MKHSELFWIVGLLEGEGSFMRGPPSDPKRPRISLQMTDEDVVARAASLLGVGYVRQKDRRNKNWKPTFAICIRGLRAVRLMALFRKFLGSRRQSQVDRAVRNFVAPQRKLVLNARKVRAIRGSEKTISALSRLYGVSRRTIRRVQKRVIWKHVA